MANLKNLIVEIHRRSLWQVLAVYLGASWIVLEVSDQVIDRYLLPEWVYGAAFVLLAVGLPIVLATAVVREERGPSAAAEPRDPTLLGETTVEIEPAAAARPAALGRLFTWPRAIAGGVVGFIALGVFSMLIVLQGAARVTSAEGEAADAFEERAWIIVAEFEAPEEEADVALAARTALTLDLEQSKFVNVRGRNQLEPVLRRMGLPDTTRLDERLALEVAEREGIAAVLAASISPLGDDYVLGARVLQPGTGDDLIVVSAAVGSDRLLEGVQTLSREVRSRLGEERSAIQQSRPLPEVTTRSLDALKAYARAVEANESADFPRAAELAEDAIRFDSTFAMAYRLASVANSNMGRISRSISYAGQAYEHRERLTERERLFLEARYQSMVLGDPRQAVATYERVLADYPDDSWALTNMGVLAGNWLGDGERAYNAYLKALSLDPYSSIAYNNIVSRARFIDKLSVADSIIGLAEERGFTDRAARWRRDQAIAIGDWSRADALCDSLLSSSSSPASSVGDQSKCGALDIARGRIRRATQRLEQASDQMASRRQYIGAANTLTQLVLAEQMRGRPAAAGSRVEALLQRLPADSLGSTDRVITRTNLRAVVGELGRPDLDALVREAYPPPDTSNWVGRFTEHLGDAAFELGRGDADRALEQISAARAIGVSPPAWDHLLDLLAGLAFAEIGTIDSSVHYLEAASHPGPVADYSNHLAHLPILLRRLAELEESRGDNEAAVDYYQRYLDLWSEADPELRDQVTSAQRAVARLSGGEPN